MAILAALNSSTISRLRKTWDGLTPKYRLLLDNARKYTEHTRNYAEYRSQLRNAQPPSLPFLGLYLTDLTFCYEGNPSHRVSPLDSSLKLINFDRYIVSTLFPKFSMFLDTQGVFIQKMTKIVNDMQRFQVPYNIFEVPEVQIWLNQSLQSVQVRLVF